MNKLILSLLVLLSLDLMADASDLNKGILRGNEKWKDYTSFLIARNYYPKSVLLLEGEELVTFSTGISIYDFKNQKKLFGTNLKRWPQELQNKKVAEMYTLGSDPEYAQEYHYTTSSKPVLGCLSHSPLRYGDLDDDGKSELVLFLGQVGKVLDLVMFNPDKEKIQFSARVIFTDATDWDYGDNFKYQYASNHNMSKGAYVGSKTYAKVFMGEFDGNESSPDIIVWRKHYTSLSKNTSTKGFKLASQNYQFYTLKDGEYQLQISLEAQIENWMSEFELTWSKGYPSKSECAGQEGQLIPEMHDPLLNDPDVLK